MTLDRAGEYDRPHMTWIRGVALVCAAWVACAAPAARAQDGGPQGERTPTEAELADARHSFEVGRQAYDAGEYAAAASEFRAALELTGAADLWFNVYLAEERGGRLEPAAEALASYLREGTIEPDQRALLERRLERLRARIESRTTPPPSDQERAEDLQVQDLMRDSAEAIGSPVAAATQTTPTETAPPPPVPASPGPHPAAIGTLVGAGVLLVAFAVLAPLSYLEDQALASRCGRDTGRFCDPSETTTLEALNIAADVSWIGAAALGVAGIVMLFALPSEELPSEQPPAVAIAPFATPHAAGIAAGGTF